MSLFFEALKTREIGDQVAICSGGKTVVVQVIDKGTSTLKGQEFQMAWIDEAKDLDS